MVRGFGSQRALLGVLTFVNLFNYLDRYVVSALVESLKQSELAISDLQAGLLMTGFIVVYMIASPIFGVLGDRRARPPLVALGVLLWSLATFAAGSARSFATLFLTRASVGIGEAAYGTIAPAMLADAFDEKVRGRTYAIFFAAIPIGSALGYVLGGWVSAHWGWRAAFRVAGIPGLLLAWLVWRLRDPARTVAIAPGAAAVPSDRGRARARDYVGLLRRRSYRLTLFGYAAYTFGLGGLAFWMPAFLERVRGISKDAASIQFGALVIATGFIGTFIGGWWGDRWQARASNGYVRFSALTAALAAPASVIGLAAPSPALFWPAMIVTQLCLFASTGPLNSAVVQLVPLSRRAMGVAACNFLIHVLGDVPSPPLIGWISDHAGLAHAVFIVPIAFVICAWFWFLAARATLQENVP